jgi:phage protein D
VPPEIRAARPAFAVDGQPKPELSGGLVELRVEESTSGLYSCEATFANWGPAGGGTGFLLFDRRTLDFGRELVVDVGGDELFRGRISGLEGAFPEGRPPTLTVLVEDRLQDLRLPPKRHVYEDATAADVFTQIANENRLQPDVDAPGPTYRHLYQMDRSDLAFLRERAQLADAEVWVDERTLKVRTYAARNAGSVTLSYGSDLREFTVTADLADQVAEVRVYGWSHEDKDASRGTATDSALGAELGSGESGASILARTTPGRFLDVVSHLAPETNEVAQQYAESLFKQRARRFVAGRGVADGAAQLRAGVTLTLQGLGPLFSGDYHVTEVRHLFDQVKGYRTEFAVERPGIGRAA